MTAIAEVVNLFAMKKVKMVLENKIAAVTMGKAGFFLPFGGGETIRRIKRKTSAIMLLAPAIATGCHGRSLINSPLVLIKNADKRIANCPGRMYFLPAVILTKK
jgi:hypothetical protein